MRNDIQETFKELCIGLFIMTIAGLLGVLYHLYN